MRSLHHRRTPVWKLLYLAGYRQQYYPRPENNRQRAKGYLAQKPVRPVGLLFVHIRVRLFTNRGGGGHAPGSKRP